MSNRPFTILIIAVLVLVGFNLAELQVLITNFFLGRDLPSTLWFRIVFWIWAAVAAGAAWLGLYGSYRAIRSNEIENRHLKAFLLIICFIIRVDGKDLGWSAFRLSFFLGVDHLAVGVNFLGIALYLWYARVRELMSRPLRPLEPTDASSRAV